MKKIIETSIALYGMGHPDVKNIFNIDKDKEEIERKHPFFRSLETLQGRKMSVFFDYTEGEGESEETKSSSVQLVFPKNKTEEQIKEFIISQINNHLNN
jgi:hypothetical protein